MTVYRVVDSITHMQEKSIQMLGRYIKRPHNLPRSFSSPTLPLLAKPKKIPEPPVGTAVIKASNLRAFLFEFSLKDPSSSYLDINSCEVKLQQSKKKDIDELASQLSIVLGGGRVSKMVSCSCDFLVYNRYK